MLDQLKNELTDHPHVFITNIPIEDGDKAGNPYLWLVVDEKETVILLSDTGYGLSSSFVNNELRGIRDYFFTPNNREHIGLGKHIFMSTVAFIKKVIVFLNFLQENTKRGFRWIKRKL